MGQASWRCAERLWRTSGEHRGARHRVGRTVLAGSAIAAASVGADPQDQRHGILAAIQHGVSNVRIGKISAQNRLTARRAFGFHSPQAPITLVILKITNQGPPLPW